jgi:hypothetical protein
MTSLREFGSSSSDLSAWKVWRFDADSVKGLFRIKYPGGKCLKAILGGSIVNHNREAAKISLSAMSVLYEVHIPNNDSR